MNEFVAEFSEWLRGCLEDHGMSQNELARKMNTTPSCVSKWVCGRTVPGAEKFQDLLDLFNFRIHFDRM